MKTPMTTKEVERGEILRYLTEAYPGVATFRAIVNYLDSQSYSATNEDVGFHLAYLCQKGFVELEYHPKRAGDELLIRAAKITPAGIDLIDQRKAGDAGVRF